MPCPMGIAVHFYHKQFDYDEESIVTGGQFRKMPHQGTKPGVLQVPGELQKFIGAEVLGHKISC